MITHPKIDASAIESFEWNGTRMARRRYQRGQLIRSSNGWTARFWEDSRDEKGAIVRNRRTRFLGTHEDYPTKRLAQRALDEVLDPINSVEFKPLPTVRFTDFAKRWQEKMMSTYEASTQGSYGPIINAQLVPAFGEMAMKDITLETIQAFVSSSPRAPKTIKNIVSVMMVIWQSALAWGYVSHNPFPRGVNGKPLLKMPKVVKGKGYAFTVEETLAIIDKAPDRWKIFFRILAETGIRPGELAGLRMSDVGQNSISIERSIWRGHLKAPKTQSGVRKFSVSQSLCDAIRALQPGKDGHVFVGPQGKVMSTDHFRERILRPILKELGILDKVTAMGIDRCGNYAFRHTSITEQSRRGVPIKTIQKRVGHVVGSDVTGMHYIHHVDADDLAAAETMGTLFIQ